MRVKKSLYENRFKIFGKIFGKIPPVKWVSGKFPGGSYRISEYEIWKKNSGKKIGYKGGMYYLCKK